MSDVVGGDAAPPPSPDTAQSRQPTIRGVSWLSVAVPLVLLSPSIYTLFAIRKGLGLDDWFILIAMVRPPSNSLIQLIYLLLRLTAIKVLLVAYGAVIEASVTKGLGRHLEYVMINMPLRRHLYCTPRPGLPAARYSVVRYRENFLHHSSAPHRLPALGVVPALVRACYYERPSYPGSGPAIPWLQRPPGSMGSKH